MPSDDQMRAHLVHLVHADNRCDAAMIACADARLELESFLGVRQQVLIHARNGAASLKRAALLGLTPDAVVRSWQACEQMIARPERNDTPLIIVEWGSDAASGLDFGVGVDGDVPHLRLIIDLIGGTMETLHPELNSSIQPLPPDANPGSGRDFEADESSKRALRDRLGLGDDDLLVLPLADPPDDVDAHAMAELSGILAMASFPVVTVIPRRARFVDRAIRAWREGYFPRLLLTDDPIASFIPAADVGVLPGDPAAYAYASFVLLRHAHRCGMSVAVGGEPQADSEQQQAPAAGLAVARGTRPAALAGACKTLFDGHVSSTRRERRTLADALRERHESIASVVVNAVETHLQTLRSSTAPARVGPTSPR